MTTFRIESMNAAGQEMQSQVEAASLEAALVQVRARGQFPLRVREVAAPKQSRAASAGKGSARRIFLGRVSTRSLTEFTQQLSILQDAGLPIVRSLKILHHQERRGPLRHTLADVADAVENGATLSESMARHPKCFSRLYVNMICAGETGGLLEVILQRLAEFMEKAQRLRRRIIGAMIYPCTVIVVALLIVTGILTFVVPKFRDIFRDFKTDLPAITLWLMNTADFVAHHFGWAIILGSPVGVWLLIKLTRSGDAGRRLLDGAALRLPVLGKITRKSATSRFARTLGTLLAAGVPILDALQIARDTVGNSIFERALASAHHAIREGRTLAAALRESRTCDFLVCNMIDVAEETGELDKMLLKIADTYDEQIDVLIGSLVSLLEPVMVIVLGAIVGTIVLALFMPLVKIMSDLTSPGG